MKKRLYAIHRFQRENRRQTSFVISIMLIGLILVASLIGIFTGKFRPFADIVSINPPSPMIDANSVTIPPGTLAFTDSDGKQQLVSTNSLNIGLGALPIGAIPLQGISKNADTEAHLGVGGKISVKKSDGSAVTSAPVDWHMTGFSDDKAVKAEFDDPQLLDAIDAANTGAFTFTVKPTDYLGVSASINGLDQTISFPEAAIGDLSNDNVIDEVDFGMWTSHFGQPVDGSSTRFDFNKDGAIDETDFSLAFTKNFGKTGAGL